MVCFIGISIYGMLTTRPVGSLILLWNHRYSSKARFDCLLNMRGPGGSEVNGATKGSIKERKAKANASSVPRELRHWATVPMIFQIVAAKKEPSIWATELTFSAFLAGMAWTAPSPLPSKG